ncbi:MAG TPA: hypothetical protein PK854_11690 [Oscillospiraceae bacterium]|nr:hypothetical protein [Oscillospiraceae bacterium]
MSTAVSNDSATPKSPLVGTGRYFRFTLKHNLMRYLVWILVIVGMIAFVGAYYKDLFKTQADLDQFAALGSNPGMVALIGKVGSATLGGAVWTKLWMTLAMTLAIGMVFQVTKGARADEENGRTELFRSRPFGIHSTLTAVVGGALLLCVFIGALTVFASYGIGLDPAGAGMTGSVVFGLSLVACGFLGVGVGALTNQLSASATMANSTGSVVIVAFYVIRMLGDMGDNAAVWFSPIGWSERMAPWQDNYGWLFIPTVALTAVLITAAFLIEARRDYGSGVFKDKRGRADAKPLMRRSWGLVLHFYKGSIIGWACGMALTGLLFGSVAKTMLDMLGSIKVPFLQGNSMNALMGLLLCIMGMVAMVLPLQIMTGLRSDEAKGLTESQLAGGMSRYRLVGERMLVSLCLLVMLLLIGGASTGVSYGAVANDLSQSWKLAIDALVYLPGIAAVMGIVVLLFGFVPRATLPVTWFLYGAMYFDVLIGDALKLPDWVTHMMPFTGTPRIPYESFNASVFGFAAAAVVFTALGLLGLRKRDIPK